MLAVDIDGGRIVRVADGETTVVATPGGGPNGLALRDERTAVVANNGGFLWTEVNGHRIPIDHATHTNEPSDFAGGWIEDVDLSTGAVTVLHREVGGRSFRGPNDLIFDEVGGLWFTDHGKGRYESVDRGGLVYAPPDGGPLEMVAFPLLGPNGVGLSPDGSTVYAADDHRPRWVRSDLAEGLAYAEHLWSVGSLGRRASLRRTDPWLLDHRRQFLPRAVEALGLVANAIGHA